MAKIHPFVHQAKREKGAGILDDTDFNEQVVMTMMKDYFHNLAEQYKTHISPEKSQRYAKKQTDGKRRGRCATAAIQCHEAIEEFEKSYEVEGVAAMIDTDFGLEYLSCLEENLSDNSKSRRQDQNIGKGARVAIGLRWRLPDYVALLHVLDAIRRRRASTVLPQAPAAQTDPVDTDKPDPPAKRHKVNARKEVHKAIFEANPQKMTDRYPNTSTGSTPFQSMVNPGWLTQNPSKKVAETDLKWLEGFYSHALEKGDLSKEEKAYLIELAAWVETEYTQAEAEAEAEAVNPPDVNPPITTEPAA